MAKHCKAPTAKQIGSSLVARAPVFGGGSRQNYESCRAFVRVSDGTRTRDRLDHNQGLLVHTPARDLWT